MCVLAKMFCPLIGGPTTPGPLALSYLGWWSGVVVSALASINEVIINVGPG